MSLKFWNVFFLVLFIIQGSAFAAYGQTNDEKEQSASESPVYDWPREFYSLDGRKLEVHQPQLIDWDNYERIDAISAVAFYANETADPSYGVLRFSARTDADFETREVLLTGFKLININFSDLDDATTKRISAKVGMMLSYEKAMLISMDRILAGLPGNQPTVKILDKNINTKAPPIFYSQSPAVLVMLDGEPILQQIKDSDLTFAVNTNWALFYKPENQTFYILDKDLWLETKDLKGEWQVVESLPADFLALPDDGNWTTVKASIGVTPKDGSVPKLFVSYSPAELILVDGEPLLEGIEGTQLMWITNTDSDVFFSLDTNNYYFLVSGRWFRTAQLDSGDWVFATPDLPADFALIPEDSPRGRVLVAVAGTPQAEDAVILASLPQKARVKKSDATLEVVYAGDPEFKAIEGTSMSYAVNTSSSVIKVDNSYMAVENGVWFTSTSPTGPWVVATEVPDVIYTIPPESPMHNTTYVYVYSSDPQYVYVGYTSGYWGVYYAYGTVMYGAGWYYPPYYWYNPRYPYYPRYYGYWASYGYRAYYNPYTGTYGRAGYIYGPYGGFAAGARYNPRTGTYARGEVAWGSGWAEGWAQVYNPSTGRGAFTYQGANSYSRWGTTVVRSDSNWAQAGHYRNADGGAFGYRTSQGGKGGVVYKNGNIYAGHDGNVYKHDQGGGWEKYSNGSWNNTNIPSSFDSSSLSQDFKNSNLSSRTGTGSGVLADRQSPSNIGTGGGVLSNDRNWTMPNSQNTNRQLNQDSWSRNKGTRQQNNRQDWQRSGNYKGYGENRQRPQRSGGRRR